MWWDDVMRREVLRELNESFQVYMGLVMTNVYGMSEGDYQDLTVRCDKAMARYHRALMSVSDAQTKGA